MADVVTMPILGFDMAEGTLITWVKKEGNMIEKGEVLAEIETDKATVEIESMYGGTVRKHLVKEGTIVPVNTPIAIVGTAEEDIDVEALVGAAVVDEQAPAAEPAAGGDGASAQPASAAQTAAPATPAAPISSSQNGDGLPGGVKASPLARRMAQENNIALGSVAGTGPEGRIVKRDIEAHLAAPSVSVPALGTIDLGSVPADQIVPLSRLRGLIGQRMTQSKVELPHFYVTRTYNMDALMAVRKQVNVMLEGSGEKISVNDFIVKAAALALRQYPNLNASLDDKNVIQHGHVNIGIAVAVENGLLTVVCADTDRKPLRVISAEIKERAARVRSGKVHADDITGSTFSVSNLGMFDVTHFTAIINPPEVAILAVGAAQQVPVVADGVVKPGWRMNVTVSIDHRVSDGAEAAQFMQALGHYLENPAGLLL